MRIRRSGTTHSIMLRTVVLCWIISSAISGNNSKVASRVKEGEPKGTTVANMARIFSLRYDERPGRKFKLLSQTLVTGRPNKSKRAVHLVDLDEKSGIMTLNKILDREELCGRSNECTLQVQAVMLPQRYFNMLNLDLVIEDTNDNTPTFGTRQVNATINEGDVKAGGIVNVDHFQAYDKDIGNNGKISYKLSTNSYFDIEQYEDEAGTSHLQLKVLKTPDHEVSALHKLKLIATDGGDVPLSNDVIAFILVEDANDHDPVFDQQEYSVHLEENADKRKLVTTVHASDQDSGDFGRVRYFLPAPTKLDKTNERASHLITVNEETGEVRLKGKLDRESHDGMRILIEARDSDPVKTRIGKTWLLINVDDVNDNAPVIRVNFIIDGANDTVFISESAAVGTYVAYVSATDADNGANGHVKTSITTMAKDRYSKEMVETHGQFHLATDGLLGTGRLLDRETCQSYVILMKACDQGTPARCSLRNITATILDENEHTPLCDANNLIVTLSENSAVDTVVTRVTAYDKDKHYTPSLWKNENNVIETSLNGVVQYSIVAGNSDYFSVDRTTGDITLLQSLDHETKRQWKLTVRAEDGGKPKPLYNNCSVIIRVDDVNDNPPIFLNPKENNTEIYATILNDQVVMPVRARDLDDGLNSKINYKILEEDSVPVKKDGRHHATFIINPTTGDLRINFSKPNLTDTLGWHAVLIKISDSGVPKLSSTTLLHIKVTQKSLPNPLTKAGFDNTLFIIIIVLGVASLILIIIISVVLTRCRKNRKRSRTYNCRTAEGKDTAWISTPPNMGDTLQTPQFKRANIDIENNTLNTSASKNNRIDELEEQRDVNVTQMMINPCDERNQGSMSTFRSDGKTTRTPLLVLPMPTSSSADHDSGRGDSDPETGNFESNDYRVPQPLEFHEEKPPESHHSSQIDSESIRTSELGPRCDETCREYGHSDTCWMPSPSKDTFFSRTSTLPYSRVSHASSLTSSTPHLHHDYPAYQTASQYDSMTMSGLPRYQIEDNYEVNTPEQEYPDYPNNRQMPPDYYYHGYGSELETIEETIPLEMTKTYHNEDNNFMTSGYPETGLDEFSVRTRAVLSSSLRSPDPYTTSNLGHRAGSRVSLASSHGRPLTPSIPYHNGDSGYSNPPYVHRVHPSQQDPILPKYTTQTNPSSAGSSRLSSCSSEYSSKYYQPSRMSNMNYNNNNISNGNNSPSDTQHSVNDSTARLTPLPKLSELSNGYGVEPSYPYTYHIPGPSSGGVSIEEAQEILSDIDKLLVSL